MSYFLAKQCQSNLSKFPGNSSMKSDADEKWKTATIQKRFYAWAFSHEIMTEKGKFKACFGKNKSAIYVYQRYNLLMYH